LLGRDFISCFEIGFCNLHSVSLSLYGQQKKNIFSVLRRKKKKNKNKKKKIKKMLETFKELFDGKLGTFKSLPHLPLPKTMEL
jgi:uncharacterized protein YyaL (SSP411 family)